MPKVQKEQEPVVREHTIHLHRLVQGRQFKKRAPYAIKMIKRFAEKAMGTRDVRLALDVNTFVWKNGIKAVPHRMRVRLARKRNEDEDAKEKMYTLVTHVPLKGAAAFKKLVTKKIDVIDSA